MKRVSDFWPWRAVLKEQSGKSRSASPKNLLEMHIFGCTPDLLNVTAWGGGVGSASCILIRSASDSDASAYRLRTTDLELHALHYDTVKWGKKNSLNPEYASVEVNNIAVIVICLTRIRNNHCVLNMRCSSSFKGFE